jgi:hypothetical protein
MSFLRITFLSGLFLAAISLVIVAFILITGGGLDDLNPANKVLEVTDQDIDPETTLAAKTLLKQNQIDSRIATILWTDAQQQLTGTVLDEAEQGLRKNQVNAALQPLVKKLADDFEAGRAAVYSIWIRDEDQQAGASVDLQLNAVPLGRFAIEANRYAITLVQRIGAASQIRIIGIKEVHGGTVFRAETATSEAETRHLHPTRSDTFELVTKGR